MPRAPRFGGPAHLGKIIFKLQFYTGITDFNTSVGIYEPSENLLGAPRIIYATGWHVDLSGAWPRLPWPLNFAYAKWLVGVACVNPLQKKNSRPAQPWSGTVAQQLTDQIWVNRAFCGKSMKLGTDVYHTKPTKFSYSAKPDFPCGVFQSNMSISETKRCMAFDLDYMSRFCVA